MRLIAYVRVSSEKQHESGASIDAQIEKVKAMASIKGFPLMEIINDSGESGKDLDRPGMKRILEMVKRREIDGLIIPKLDRLTRSVRDLDNLMRLFQASAVSLVSVHESLDMSTATGRLMMNLLSLVSQWEREIIGERTSAALQQIKRAGFPAGPPQYGWSAQKRAIGSKERLPLVPNEAEQHTIRVILEMHRRGDSYREMADSLNAAGYRTRKGGKWTFPAMGQIIKANSVVVAE